MEGINLMMEEECGRTWEGRVVEVASRVRQGGK